MADIDAEDVPPLEDMSHTLNQLQQLNLDGDVALGPDHNTNNPVTGSKSPQSHIIHERQTKSDNSTKDKPITKVTTNVPTKQSSHQSNNKFGGLKKGFLFGNSSSSSSSPAPVSETSSSSRSHDSIPYLKKQESKDEPLRLPEVEAAMKSTEGLLKNQDWVTDSLLEKVSRNPTLAKNLADPRFAQALSEFQANPQAATAKYEGNKEVQMFFKEFCGLLGDHFNELSEITSDDSKFNSNKDNHLTPIDPEQVKVNEILSDTDTRELLLDPDLQSFLSMLKNDPHGAQRFLNHAEPGLKVKIDKLIKLGLLQVQQS